MTSERSIDRRAYLTAVGSGAVAALAGCLGEPSGEGTTTSGGGGGQSTDGETTEGTDSAGNETGTDSGTTQSGEEQAITAGTAPGFPPFEIKKGEKLTGFDIELLEAVVSQAPGYTLDGWQEFEFGSLIPALTGGNIDVIAAAMTITEERKQTIAFTDPYYEADQSILVRKGGDFQPSQLSDLEGHAVGAQSDTTGEQVVQDELSDVNYNGYGSYVLAVTDLENGNIDAVVLDKPVAQTFAEQRNVEVAFTYETGEEYGFGIRQNQSDLQSALNEGLSTVQENGTYEELRNKWFSES